ncbi:MAG: metal-dependent phosphohydrolase [Leptolyngbyaceae cyanobacterium bins.59]|nr:metal-dependent phosphohydrolase [Leptolyngbyaceae cyanobacterium bins.59]
MLNPTNIVIDAFVASLQDGYHRTYGGLNPNYSDIIGWAGNMALENIANSDALYHNVEHTIFVSLVGQEILRGRQIIEGKVTCQDWLHVVLSLLCHDIGYVKGVCQQDNLAQNLYATGLGEDTVFLSPGSTDASLNPYHVDRGKLFVEERFGGHHLINTDVIKRNIELTRFPVPSDLDHQDTVNYPGLVRAADLIGQLSDPRYLQKISALFYEFVELGIHETFGYRSPGDLRQNYPRFYWNVVYPYIQPALRYLSVTQEGKQIIANLYANVFRIEHEKACAA